ncbi:Rha family transcriptional regulator, partial [Pseudomonas aeruginosa]|uniref:Rha family transcriptional regulator n=3 Tax=Pseudomonas TaxID=286 RepID=UPI003F2F0F46
MTGLTSIGGQAATMTSREIADLVGSRHDNVRVTIERLAERGVIALPAMQEKPTAGRPTQEYVFTGDQGKRDSIIVVAQLCPEFTAQLVDRWQELEQQA